MEILFNIYISGVIVSFLFIMTVYNTSRPLEYFFSVTQAFLLSLLSWYSVFRFAYQVLDEKMTIFKVRKQFEKIKKEYEKTKR